MSKKQIQNRLDKLFDGLQSTDDNAKTPQKSKLEKPVSASSKKTVSKPYLKNLHQVSGITTFPAERISTETYTQLDPNENEQIN